MPTHTCTAIQDPPAVQVVEPRQQDKMPCSVTGHNQPAKRDVDGAGEGQAGPAPTVHIRQAVQEVRACLL